MKSSKLFKSAKTPLFTAIAGVSFLLGSSSIQAQMLEEVVVTAQKRVESLQDVPISITAVSGDTMAENGVFKIEDLQAFTPNLSMTETGVSTQIFVRGIGTGNNAGFEQSVGTYVDGIYYGRQQLLRMPFLDLERIEVLRGPQSILFGKNSIAGALNMTTAKPTDEFEGKVSGNYSPDGDITEFIGVVSGPLTDNLSGRLALRKYDEEGWMENTFNGDDELERDDTAVRGALRWDATDNLRIDFKAEWNEFNTSGRQIEIVQDDPAPGGSATFADILTTLGHPDAITEVKQNNKRQADTGDDSENEVENYTMNIDYAIGDMTLTAVTGYVTYDFEEENDLDFVGAPIIFGILGEEYEQFSQEIRLVSPGGETVDWIAGAFYQTSEQDFSTDVYIPENSVLGTLGLVPVVGTVADQEYTAESELWAVFAQATWNFSDFWSITLGGRYTEETKDATREVNIRDSDTGDFVPTGGVAAALWRSQLGVDSEQWMGHSLGNDGDGKRDESVFTPLVTVQWEASDEVMLYASWSTGFKSGGFDAAASINTSWEFEEEEATTYEIGAKTTLADGSAEVNVAIYRTEYDDLQTSQFDGVLGFVVGNAKETIVQGVELDGRWALTENLTMGYGVAYLDHEYKDFSNGTCYNTQEPDGDVIDGVELCDYTGKRGQFTPEWSGNLSFLHVYPIGDRGLELQSSFDLSYKDEQNTHVNLDPQWEVDSLTQINLRMGLYAPSWDLAVLVQNVTDEQQFSYVGNTPLSGSTFGTDTFYSFITRPRATYIQATYHF